MSSFDRLGLVVFDVTLEWHLRNSFKDGLQWHLLVGLFAA